MLCSNSENKTAPSLLSDNHEEDEISSINENQVTLFSQKFHNLSIEHPQI